MNDKCDIKIIRTGSEKKYWAGYNTEVEINGKKISDDFAITRLFVEIVPDGLVELKFVLNPTSIEFVQEDEQPYVKCQGCSNYYEVMDYDSPDYGPNCKIFPECVKDGD